MSVGTGSRARFQAMAEVATRQPRGFTLPTDDRGQRMKVSDYYGLNTFSLKLMKDKLPKDVFQKISESIQTGKKIDIEIANTVAHAVKEWAIARGVTHFCHWFQPQTGLTAEKHDAFMTFEKDGSVIEKFSGSQLIQSEPDASSFPSGGMRTTFEARGYTAWDPASPMFIMDGPNTKTLCIPSAFISYTGETLDEKTGLLRSIEVLSNKTCELLSILGYSDIKRVVPTLGAEQEYFLIDRALYNLRPDLMMCGRTLIGGQPPKGQQLEDHYFGSIPSRVLSFMTEVEYELFKLGVPAKTRHNEVAPNQFEAAPIFEEANISTDHNQLFMEVIHRVAARHNFAALLHEKPFAGINGSGKHCNWSMQVTASGAQDGENLLEPGKTPRQNIRFLLVLAGVLKGVHKHSGLLRAAIASAGNDHRLGANEAPPAIISVFLGDQLTTIANEIEKGALSNSSAEQAMIKLGVAHIPEVAKDQTDRNRTSPFAFTGNKFEFRAVGASASTALPVTLLNVAVADAFDELADRLRKKGAKPGAEAPVLDVIREVLTETKAVRFEGNGYSEEWVKEAAKRGLPNLKKTPEALAELMSAVSKAAVTKLGVFSEAELGSRYHVRTERFIKKLTIEADTLKHLIDSQVLPACFAYQGMLAQTVASAKAAGVKAPQFDTLTALTDLIIQLQERRKTLDQAVEKAESKTSEEEKAKIFSLDVATAMQSVRETSDALEGIVSDDYWPMPKYREMLAVFA